jgi:pyruvate,water dikinase
VKRAVFERTLRWGRASSRSRENVKSEAVRWLASIRRGLLVLGDRLAEQGAFDEPDDVFFLTHEEIKQAVAGSSIAQLRAAVESRRDEYERWSKLNPPSVVVGEWDESAAADSGTGSAPAVASAHGRVLRGISVSAGVVRGPARVFRSVDTDETVLAGEILVAPFTDPGWTPYFVPAAGIVMDMGGMLSHGSIIAREYGMPAVVNVGSATKHIVTGQIIEVDGDRGEVRLIEERGGR